MPAIHPGGKSAAAFRTISEESSELDVPQHVLRFWESKFSQVRPMKRGDNRRYYRPEDVELLRAIRHHLYTEGYTIKGVQKLLKEHGVKDVVAAWRAAEFDETSPEPAASDTPAPAAASTEQMLVKAVLDELKAIRKFIEDYDD